MDCILGVFLINHLYHLEKTIEEQSNDLEEFKSQNEECLIKKRKNR